VTLKKLEVIAPPDKPTIITRRVLDAPRALVFDAFTKPEHLKRWLGPRVFAWVTCDIDLRVGGGYRWVQRAPDGQEFSFRGEYKEIVRPEKLVSTFVFETFAEDEALETLTLEENDGQTIATTLSVHKTVRGRDAHLAKGRMEEGMVEGYERLDDLLDELIGR
jgi:uncharacterized protein YndB with AHSA1/START domain